MKYIINLSSVHEDSLAERITAFAQLCNDYSKSLLSKYCLPFFSNHVNKAWVILKSETYKPLINDYKIGKITTEQFLDKMVDVFYFLKRKSGTFFNDSDKERLFEHRVHMLSLKKIHHRTDFTGEIIARALIEEAWTFATHLPDNDRFGYLLEQLQPNDCICFISNSNELDITNITRLLREKHPEIAWYKSVDLAPRPNEPTDSQPIKLSENISLAVSYRFNTFKTDNDNANASISGTPSLLSALVTSLFSAEKRDNITVISQYGKDLEQAISLGIPQENCRVANDFYQKLEKQETLKMK